MLKNNISSKKIYMAYKLFFGTLTSRTRLLILNSLRKEAKSVSQLQKDVKLEQSIVSHDLRRLKRCGFVKGERKGRFVIYSLNKKTIKPLLNIIDKHMEEYCMKIIEKEKRR